MEYQVVQINGQRIFGPKLDSNIPKPSKGTEIFIGNLPQNVTEEDLFNAFVNFGPIYKIRLMLTFEGGVRGFGYITYFEKVHANNAIEIMHKVVMKGHQLIVVASIDNRRLFIGKIPREINKADIKMILRNYVEGIEDVIVYKDFYKPPMNRGFAFVEFVDQSSAAKAKRILTKSAIILWNRNVFVDWAMPLPEVSDEIMSQVKRLYISDIPVYCTEFDLRKYLISKLRHSENIFITRVHKEENYAFVHFRTRKMAERALKLLIGIKIDGNDLNVEWARPQNCSVKYNDSLLLNGNNYYQSVPPSLRKIKQATFDDLGLLGV